MAEGGGCGRSERSGGLGPVRSSRLGFPHTPRPPFKRYGPRISPPLLPMGVVRVHPVGWQSSPACSAGVLQAANADVRSGGRQTPVAALPGGAIDRYLRRLVGTDTVTPGGHPQVDHINEVGTFTGHTQGAFTWPRTIAAWIAPSTPRRRRLPGTSYMLSVLAELSSMLELGPGDVILTGTS
jgi:hypothetical protein